jgi:hypothetical protein
MPNHFRAILSAGTHGTGPSSHRHSSNNRHAEPSHDREVAVLALTKTTNNTGVSNAFGY